MVGLFSTWPDTRRTLARVVVAGIFLMSVTLAAARTAWIYTQTYPISFGGFYYLGEIASRLETGHGYYETFSPYFFTVAEIGALLHLRELQIARALPIIAAMLMSMALYSAGSRHSKLFALLLFSASWCSSSVFCLSYAYPREISALGLVLLGISVRSSGESSLKRRCFGIGLIAFGALSHLFAAMVAAILLAGDAIDQYRKSSAERVPRPVLLLVVLSIFCLGLGLFLHPKVLTELIGDYGVATREHARQLGWTGAFEYWELGVVTALAPCAIIAGIYFSGANAQTGFLAGTIMLMLAPVWVQDNRGLAFRFLRTSVPLLFVLLAFVAARSRNKYSAPVPALCIGMCAFAYLLPAFLGISNDLGSFGPDYPIEPLATNARALSAWIPRNGFVVAPHGVQFRITYFLNRHSAMRLPTEFHDKTYFVVDHEPSATSDCVTIKSGEKVPPNTSCVALAPHFYIEQKPFFSMSATKD